MEKKIYLNPGAIKPGTITTEMLESSVSEKINIIDSTSKSGLTYGGTIRKGTEDLLCKLSDKFMSSFELDGEKTLSEINDLSLERDLSGVYFIAENEFEYYNGVSVQPSDWLICTHETNWVKIDNTDVVIKVNGKTGPEINLTASDFGLSNVTDDITNIKSDIEGLKTNVNQALEAANAALKNVEPIDYEEGKAYLPGRFYIKSINENIQLMTLAIAANSLANDGWLIQNGNVVAKVFFNGDWNITRLFDKFGNDYPYYDPDNLPIDGTCTYNTVGQDCNNICVSNCNHCSIGAGSSNIIIDNASSVSLGANNSNVFIGWSKGSNYKESFEYEALINLKGSAKELVEGISIGNDCNNITISEQCKNISIGNGSYKIYIPGKYNNAFSHDITIENGVRYINYDWLEDGTSNDYYYYPMQHVTLKNGVNGECFKSGGDPVDNVMRNYIVDNTANLLSGDNEYTYKYPAIVPNSEHVRWITNSKIAGVIDWVPSDLYSLINEGKDLTVKIRGWIIPSQGSDQIAGFNNSEITASLNGVSSREIYLTIGTDGKSAYNDVNISYYNSEQIFASVKSELSNITFPAGVYDSGSVTKYDIVWSNTEFSGSMEYNSLNDFELGVSTESRPDLTSENPVDLTKLVYVDIFLGVDVEIEGGNSGEDL